MSQPTQLSLIFPIEASNYGRYYHWIRKYLGQYCAEVEFRYNGRKISDDERSIGAIKATEGKTVDERKQSTNNISKIA